MSSSGVGQYSARPRFREVAEQWHEEFEQLVTAGRPSPTTANQTATPLAATKDTESR